MWKKVLLGVCLMAAVLSGTVFAAVEGSRCLDGPLFYRHYITYNVRTACRDQQATRRMQEGQYGAPQDRGDPREGLADPDYRTVEWIGIAAVVHTGHTLEITSAIMDLGEYGVYKLTNVSQSLREDGSRALLCGGTETAPVRWGPRFAKGITALAFDPEDLEQLDRIVTQPITAENLIINYIYDGIYYTQNAPIGQIILYRADSNWERLSPDPVCESPALSGACTAQPVSRSFSVRLREGCMVDSVALTCPPELRRAFTLETRTGSGRLFLTATCVQEEWGPGLRYFQLDYLLRGTDEQGRPVTAVSDYQNYSFCAMSTQDGDVLEELRLRKKGGAGE